MDKNSIRTSLYNGNSDLMILTGDEDMECVHQKVPCTVLTVDGFDWDEALTPWPAEAVFKGRNFTGHADELVQYMTSLDILKKQWRHIWTGGYSLAGLFSLYLCTKTDLFEGCISCSGSLWYDGFLDYLKGHPVHCEYVYLSLGDREKHTKNERMKTVETCHEETQKILASYCDCTFVLNPGNHFQDPGGRIVKGITWMRERNR